MLHFIWKKKTAEDFSLDISLLASCWIWPEPHNLSDVLENCKQYYYTLHACAEG